MADALFDGDGDDEEFEADKELTFPEFMDIVLHLRGANPATLTDILGLKVFISQEFAKRQRQDMRLSMKAPRTTSSQNLSTMGTRSSLGTPPSLLNMNEFCMD